jgi:hypothetical protein
LKFHKIPKTLSRIFLDGFSKVQKQLCKQKIHQNKFLCENSIINLETSSTNHWTNSQNIHHFTLEISKQNKKKIESFFSNSSSWFLIFSFFSSYDSLSGSLDNEVDSHIMLSMKNKRVMKYRRKKQEIELIIK